MLIVSSDSEPNFERIFLTELQEFRKDSSQKLTDIRKDNNKIYKRVEETEERIDAVET